MTDQARLIVQMPAEERHALEQKANSLGMSTGEFLRLAIEAFEIGTKDEEAELRGIIDLVNDNVPNTLRLLDECHLRIEEALGGVRPATDVGGNVAAEVPTRNVPNHSRRPDDASRIVDRHVGKRMRERRKVLGLPIKQLAESAGVTVQKTREWENGSQRITANRLTKLAEVLNVPVSYFFAGPDEQGSYGATSPQARGENPHQIHNKTRAKVIGKR